VHQVYVHLQDEKQHQDGRQFYHRKNTDSLDTALSSAVQYESAMNIGGQKQGGAQRYGQVAAMEITGSATAPLRQHLHSQQELQECRR
jgi:hypothetical protein